MAEVIPVLKMVENCPTHARIPMVRGGEHDGEVIVNGLLIPDEIFDYKCNLLDLITHKVISTRVRIGNTCSGLKCLSNCCPVKTRY